MDRRKMIGLVKALEKRFGIPLWDGPSDPLDSLIRTILSQNTNDLNRDRAYDTLRKRCPAWEQVLRARPGTIADAIRVGGLANQKSVRIKAVLAWLKKRHGALTLDPICAMSFDEAMESFGHLKGVGVKTLAVVMMFACGQDIFPVDTHVHRICCRLGLVPMNTTAEKTFFLMRENVPRGMSYSLHMNMLTLGRTICQARSPKCDVCPILRHCPTGQERHNAKCQVKNRK